MGQIVVKRAIKTPKKQLDIEIDQSKYILLNNGMIKIPQINVLNATK